MSTQKRGSANIDERMIHENRGSYVSSSAYHTRTVKRRVARRERRESKVDVRNWR